MKTDGFISKIESSLEKIKKHCHIKTAKIKSQGDAIAARVPLFLNQDIVSDFQILQKASPEVGIRKNENII